jgi:hypothetical protein
MDTITFYILTTEHSEQQTEAGVAPPLPAPVAAAARRLRHELQQQPNLAGARVWISSRSPLRIIVRNVPEGDAVVAAAIIEHVVAEKRGWKYLMVRDSQA